MECWPARADGDKQICSVSFPSEIDVPEAVLAKIWRPWYGYGSSIVVKMW